MNYDKVKPSKINQSKFDLDLSIGNDGERMFLEIITAGTVEVKSEQGRWAVSGNICIERASYGRPSGLEKTESDYWVQNLMVDGKHYATIVFPTEVLKKIVEVENPKEISGGDHNASSLWLLRLSKVFSKNTVEKVIQLCKGSSQKN